MPQCYRDLNMQEALTPCAFQTIFSLTFLMLHTTTSSKVTSSSATSSGSFVMHNPGDRHGLFHFSVPSKFHGAVLGPETYSWLVRRFGQSTIDREGIFRAPSDDHTCGTAAWCRADCRSGETQDWTRKDLCGVFHCCVTGTLN